MNSKQIFLVYFFKTLIKAQIHLMVFENFKKEEPNFYSELFIPKILSSFTQNITVVCKLLQVSIHPTVIIKVIQFYFQPYQIHLKTIYNQFILIVFLQFQSLIITIASIAFFSSIFNVNTENKKNWKTLNSMIVPILIQYSKQPMSKAQRSILFYDEKMPQTSEDKFIDHGCPHHLSKIQISQLLELLFSKYDSDNSNTISKMEFHKLIKSLIDSYGGQIPNQEDIDDIFNMLDFNGDQNISRNELWSLLQRLLTICGKNGNSNGANV